MRLLVVSLRRHPVSLLMLAFFLLCLVIMGSGNRKGLKDDYRVMSCRFATAINCVARGFRGLGIGAEMMKTLAEQATVLELKVLLLHVLAMNKRAVHFCEKVGFVQTGRISEKYFREGQYID